ncbi:MAG: LysR family transcriptional regulator [Eubacteriales bacterium]|nr:LysR family transcriptional regulator [Eubacteriales bacterium]
MNRYRVFVKVVECGSFTKAAEELNYTQSAVSQMVHTLEEELDTVLILRSKNGAALTVDGEEYFPYIRSISHAHQELEEKFREMQGLNSGKIRIGSFTSVSRNWLPGLMKEFKERYPGVQFELFQGEYTNIAQWIKEGRVDFGFVNPEAVEGLQTIPLYQDEMVAVLPRGHALAGKDVVTLAELAKCPYILLDEGESSVPLDAFGRNGLTPDIQYRVYDDYSIVAMVEQGLGISILYKLVVEGQAKSCVTRPVEPAVERTVAVACKNWKTLPIASRHFLDFILESFGILAEER